MTQDSAADTGGLHIYKHVGNRIKERRKTLNMSQGQAAELMGVSYQQIQKYETGASQISLNRLFQLANILNVSPEYFYEGISLDGGIGTAIESDVIKKNLNRPLQILLVEDTPSDALLFERALKPLDNAAMLTCISDPEKLMDYLNQSLNGDVKKNMVDVLVLDINLPKISGLQLLKTVKSNSQTNCLPAVILTNSISKKEMMEAYRSGAAGFIQKSIDFQEFGDAIAAFVTYWSKAVTLPLK